jgi:hypothetical protein
MSQKPRFPNPTAEADYHRDRVVKITAAQLPGPDGAPKWDTARSAALYYSSKALEARCRKAAERESDSGSDSINY